MRVQGVRKQARIAGRVTRAAGLAAVLFAASAQAATVTFKTSETSGRTLDSVVVTLLPVGKVALPPPRPASIEQVRKAFVPLVSVVQTGAAVDFPNKDTVRHHVYSFSASKVFELKLYAGTPARPVVFDKPGVVVLGCNIHDKMVAYIMVVDTPWFAVTGDDGSARIADLPPGDYMLRAWHPRRLGMPDLPPRPIKVSADMTESVTVDLTP